MIQPAGYYAPTTYAATSPSTRNSAESANSAATKSEPTDSVEISEEYYGIKKKWKNSSALWIPATDEQLKMGGRYLSDKDGNTYFQVAKTTYQESGFRVYASHCNQVTILLD